MYPLKHLAFLCGEDIQNLTSGFLVENTQSIGINCYLLFLNRNSGLIALL